jgi:integrase
VPNHKPLTDLAIRRFPPPEEGDATFWDGAQDGLGLRISSGGAKTFIVLTGSGRRQKIGRYPTISLSDARSEAKRIKAELTLGRHRPSSVTFTAATEAYLKACAEKNRPNTVRDYTRLLKRFPFRSKLSDIRRRDIVQAVDKINAPSEAQHARVAIKVFFSWCVKQGYLENSPCEGMGGAQGHATRDHVLSAEELKKVLRRAATGSDSFFNIVQLLIHTGQRRTEIAHLQWDWINQDEKTITLPASITKNKRQSVIPYSDTVQAIFDAVPRLHDTFLFPASRDHVKGKPTSVFNGWGKAKAAFDKGLQVAPYTLHDFRRTYSTAMASLGIPQIVVEKLLNHLSGGTQSPIAQVYNRHSYLAEMREAVKAHEKHLHSLCS